MRSWRRIGIMGMILLGFATVAGSADFGSLTSEEADLLALLEMASVDQKLLETSGLLYRDEVLESYLNRVAARLNPNVVYPDGGFRAKMIKDPHLNAFTYPDGTCYIQTGILARLENEAQLAALLAHEMAHYVNEHAVNGIRRFHRHLGSDIFQQARDRDVHLSRSQVRRHLATIWSGYHHEAEFEADREALILMMGAGYDPGEAIRLFGHLAEEMSMDNLQDPLFYGSHPRLEVRIEKCRQYLASVMEPRDRGIRQTVGNFGDLIRGLLLDNIGMDIQAGRFEQALQASKRYLTLRPADARLYYLMGEIYRQNGYGGPGTDRAERFYKHAIDLDGTYPDPYRALGLLYYKKGQSQQARPFLEASLTMAPQAPQNDYIRHYLSRIQP